MSRFINPVPQFWLDDGSVASAGRMYFCENKNHSSLKNTFSKSDNTVANTNPLILDGQGRLPSCFGDGLYSVKFYAANPDNPDIDGALQWTRDDVSLSEFAGQFELWIPTKLYPINDIAKDPSDGSYYQLWGAATSQAEQPSSTPQKWEKIYFITEYNSDKTYSENEVVIKDGLIYRSDEDDNDDVPPSVKWQDLTFNQNAQDYIPVARGSTSAGVGTYTLQKGIYLKTGRLVTGTADLFWSAHTGTGNLDISLPIPATTTLGAPAGGGQVLNSQALAWTAGKQLTILIASGFSVARIIGLESTLSGAQIPLDTNGGITIQFSYLVD